MKQVLTAAVLLLLAASAQAYIGPGAGISVLGSIFSVIVGVLLAIAAIVLWPVRRMLKRKKAQRNAEPEGAKDT